MNNQRQIKEQYLKHCRLLKQSIDNEERHINFFTQERQRINYIWMLQKKKLEGAEAELINKEREKEDLDEKHDIEKKLYEQKIKFLLLKQLDENVELQKDTEIALKQVEDANRIKERDFKYDIRSLAKMVNL